MRDGDDHEYGSQEAYDPREAICLAALEALGVEVE